MHLHTFVSPKKNPLCYCNALCNVCRCVASNLLKFESTYREISKAITQFEFENVNYQKQKKKINTKLNDPSTHKPARLKKSSDARTIPRCKAISCITNPNEDLIKQNALLNQYFDVFEQKYKTNKTQLNQLKNENARLKQMMQQMGLRQKQKETKIEDFAQNNSKLSFTKRQNQIINNRILLDLTNKKDSHVFKETTSTFVSGLGHNHKKFLNNDRNCRKRLSSEFEDGSTPDNQNYHTSNDDNSRYY